MSAYYCTGHTHVLVVTCRLACKLHTCSLASSRRATGARSRRAPRAGFSPQHLQHTLGKAVRPGTRPGAAVDEGGGRPARRLAQLVRLRLAARGRETRDEIIERLSTDSLVIPADAVLVENDGSMQEGIQHMAKAISSLLSDH